MRRYHKVNGQRVQLLDTAIANEWLIQQRLTPGCDLLLGTLVRKSYRHYIVNPAQSVGKLTYPTIKEALAGALAASGTRYWNEKAKMAEIRKGRRAEAKRAREHR